MTAHIPVGLQLFSVRDDCRADLAGKLNAVADMGYACIETAGLYDHPVSTWREVLNDCGIRAVGAHVGLDGVAPDTLAETVDTYASLGCDTLVVPALGAAYRESIDGYKRAAERINAAAEKLPADMRMGYHNHAFEFEAVDGQVPYDVLLSEFSDSVLLQYDFGWLYRAGQDGVAMVNAHPGRQQTVHIKAYKADDETAVVGEDDVPWPAVFEACEANGGTAVYIVEHERYADAPLVCVRQCRDHLRAMGK